jgi:hypothetical protein
MSSHGKDTFQSRAIFVFGELKTPQMVIWLRKHGMVNTNKGAGRVLILVMCACILVTIVMVKGFILPTIFAYAF